MKKARRSLQNSLFKHYGGTIIAAVVVALIVRFFIIEAYRIPAPTMRPTLEPGEAIFVAKWPFGLRVPFMQDPFKMGRKAMRGEVVLVARPEDPQRYLIRRVIGVEGDSVQIQNGRVILNGTLLSTQTPKSENCGIELLPDGQSHGTCWEPPMIENFGPVKVPSGSVFLLGDLRTGTDATPSNGATRNWGIFPNALLRGKALWVWLSVQPRSLGDSRGWFPQFRFERMFRRIK